MEEQFAHYSALEVVGRVKLNRVAEISEGYEQASDMLEVREDAAWMHSAQALRRISRRGSCPLRLAATTKTEPIELRDMFVRRRTASVKLMRDVGSELACGFVGRS